MERGEDGRNRALSDQLDKLSKKLSTSLFEKTTETKVEERVEPEKEERVEESDADLEDAVRYHLPVGVSTRDEEEAFSRLPSRVSQKRQEERKEALGVAADKEAFSRLPSRVSQKRQEERKEVSEVTADKEASEERVKKPRREGGEDDFYKQAVQRKKEKEAAKEERKKYQEVYVNDDYVLKEGESRKASKKILANRGLTPSRPKVNRNPRVKKRRQYDKALRRRHGQVAALRTNEADQYGGEKSGIRADVTHSRVFN